MADTPDYPIEFIDDPKVLSEIPKHTSMTQGMEETNEQYIMRVKRTTLRRVYYFGPRVEVPSHRTPGRMISRRKYSLILKGLATDLTFDLLLKDRVKDEVLMYKEYTSITREILGEIIEYYLMTDS
jgi:hypothetical protein